MPLSVSQIMTPVTREQAVRTALEFLSSLGFATGSWATGSWERTITSAAAWLYADGTQAVANLASGAFNESADGDWMTLITESRYGDTRPGAVACEGLALLTSAAGSPAHSWGVQELQFSDTPDGEPHADGSPAILFYNSEAGAIGPSSSLSILIKAVAAGPEPNAIASGSTLYLLTPLTGVTATVPADPSTLTWITVPGANQRSADEQREMNALKWATLAPQGAQENCYARWAREADITITRCRPYNTGGGGVTVACATATGGISGGPASVASPGTGQAQTVLDYVEDGRRPVNDIVTVKSATVVPLVIVAAPVIDQGGATKTDIENAIDAYLGGLDIGGKVVPPSASGQVVWEELNELIRKLPGVRRANLTTPSGDVALASDEIAVRSSTITVTYVKPQ